jgi:hypothetical protein
MAGGKYFDADGNVIGGWYMDDDRVPWSECREKIMQHAEQDPEARIWTRRHRDGTMTSWIMMSDGTRIPFPTFDEWQKDPQCPAMA